MENPVIRELKADQGSEIIELESLCMNCYKNGVTRLLPVKIAFFRELILSSFTCPHCGFENRKVDSAAEIQDRGQRITLTVQSAKDLNRRVMRPSGSTIFIPLFDASFPTSEGDLSTVEGLILKIIDNINHLQLERNAKNPELASKLDTFVSELQSLLTLQQPFKIILDDPTGNGCIENLLAPSADPQLEIVTYKRTAEQEVALGFEADDQLDETDRKPKAPDGPKTAADWDKISKSIGKDEVLSFRVNCPRCNAPSETNMKLVDIPHFKEVVIMATVCSVCGHRDNEIKSGGGISGKGRYYRLRLTHRSDLSRDVLVSETASINIPHLQFESMGGTLGGRFTTMEGLLLAIRDQLISANPFALGDSRSADEKEGNLSSIIERLKKIADGEELNIIFELRDSAGNSFLQNIYAPDPDPELEVVDFERTMEENDDLGLSDMKTENY